MSQQLLARSGDLRRLAAEGYVLEIRAGHLLVYDIPHVNDRKEVVRGTFIVPLTIEGGVTGRPANHVVWFRGETPCDQHGQPMTQITHGGATSLGPGLEATHSFSNKPAEGYSDYYQLVSTYTHVIGAAAQQLDPTVTAQTGRSIVPDEDVSVFRYMDTASSRAGIGALVQRLEEPAVAVIGLGGTGAYVLDLIAKCPVRQIHLFDGDRFHQHNAFRSPGATSEDELLGAPYKVDFYQRRYTTFREGVHAHRCHVDEDSADELRAMSFAFVCVDSGPARSQVTAVLEALGVPFIDVGMGLTLNQDPLALDGSVRLTMSVPDHRLEARRHLPLGAGDVDDLYASNIQVGALNALNAALAVTRWQRFRGFYVDHQRELQAVYTPSTNAIIRTDQL